MANDSKSRDDIPENRPDNKEKAEGSRENAGGISNRTLEKEQQRQDRLPPRGESKDGSHA
jgi:hypothetical protein